MSADPAVSSGAISEGGVMGAVDDGTFLIADIRRDGAWLSMPAAAAPILTEKR